MMGATGDQVALEEAPIKAIRSFDGRACLAAIAQGANTDTADEDGFSALHAFAATGKESMIHMRAVIQAHMAKATIHAACHEDACVKGLNQADPAP